MGNYLHLLLICEDLPVPDDRQLLFHIILDVLPKRLGPYVRQRLAEEHPTLNWSSTSWKEISHGEVNLDDLSTQLFALTGRDDNGRPILFSDPALRSKLHDIRIVRNRLVHGGRFERSETVLAISEVAETLRLIGDTEASSRVFQVISRLTTSDADKEDATTQDSPSRGAGSETPPPLRPRSITDPSTTPTSTSTNAEGAANAASAPAETELDSLSITADVPPVISYAHSVAGLRLTGTIQLRSVPAQDTDLPDSPARQRRPVIGLRLTVSVEVDGVSVACAEPVFVSRLDTDGEDLAITIVPERPALLQLDTQSASRLHVLLETTGAQRDVYLDGPVVLSPRQWMMRGRPSDAAAALVTFVQPQQPRLAPLCSRAAQLLEASTGSMSLDGYQSGPERVTEIVRAVCRAIQEESIAYALPPTSWAETGQRVRTAEDVLDHRLGTCLDTTMLMASALEYLDIEPLIILLPGHALLGYWRTEHHVSQDLTMPGWELLNQIDRGEIGLVETTLLTGRSSQSFEQVHQTARQRIGVDASEIDVIIPVREARQSGVLPMPLRSRNENGEVVESTYVAAPRPNTVVLPKDVLQTARPRPARNKAPDRVEAWKAHLLDLSLRNRLINCSDSAIQSHKIVELAVPEAVIGPFEDLVNTGRDITLKPAGERAVTTRHAGGLFREELDPPRLAPLLADHREVEVDLTEENYDVVLRHLRSTARTFSEETGANNLHLALGSLVWQTKGKTIRSPLVLIPVDLERRSARSLFRLRIDPSGTTTPNYSLVERLKVDLGLDLAELSEPTEDNAGIDLPALFDIVRRVLAENRLPFHVETTTYLGIFQFGTFRLWKDLEESWQHIARNPLVQHLIDTPDQEFTDPQADAQVTDLEDLQSQLPTPADASQTEVVAQALAGRTIVVEGPPGTGKSQTITNVIVSAVANGKKVLFVAEKQAALEVVARRLREVGIGGLVLDLHDRKQSPDAVRQKIIAAMDLEAHPDHARLQSRRAFAGTGRARLAEYRSSLHRQGPAGMSFYRARTEQIAHSDLHIDPFTVTPAQLASLSEDDVHVLRTSAPSLGECVEEYGDVLLGSNPVVSRPLDAPVLTEVLTRLNTWDAVKASGDDQLLAIAGAIPDEQIDTAALILADTVLDASVLDRLVDPAWVRDAQWLLGQLIAEPSLSHPALAYYRESVLDAPLSTVRNELVDAKHALFHKTKKAEKALAPLASHRTGTPMPDDGNGLLAVIDELIALAARRNQLRHVHSTLLPWTASTIHSWSPYDPRTVSPSTMRLRQLLERANLAVAGQQPQVRAAVDTLIARPDRTAVAGWLRSYSQARRGLAGLTQIGVRPQAVNELLSYPAARRERVLRAWSDFLVQGADFHKLGLGSCLDQLLRGEVRATDTSHALDIGLVQATLELQSKRGRLGSFSAERLNKNVADYADALKDIHVLLPEALIEKALVARHNAVAGENLRLANLQAALERKRRKRKIRDLMNDFGDLITSLTPCVLVSPDSVARFFPPDQQPFDLVVFDEASQITVASAVGAMGRGRSVVICGDSKQMPPTSFAQFSRDEDVEDDVIDEESILSECVAAHVPRLWLSWHYRSRVESLIAFSNMAYYQGRLSSFPSPVTMERADGVHGFGINLRRVDGHFVRSVPRGQSRRIYRTNQAEAEAIVEEIRCRFAQGDHDPEGPSVGVVTFNIQQRDLIEAKLRALDDPRITASLDADEGVFVKNLENVQGDERDTILFSVAFSAKEDGQIPLNFGPLNQRGGERRLNVAITRAREQVILFCSFDPAQLQAERSASVGLQDLKRYLLLAQHGTAALPSSSVRPLLPDGHRDEIAQALREHGLSVRTDVGLSDFRVDLVLASPDDPDTPRVAVLLDGDGWHRRRTAFDRDVLPTRVLAQAMHWPRVERVWMPEWLQDRDSVIHRLTEAVSTNGARDVGGSIQDESESAAFTADTRSVSEAPLRSQEPQPVRLQQAPAGAANSADAMSSGASHTDIMMWDLSQITDFTPFRVTVVAERELLDQGGINTEARRISQEVAERICAIEAPISRERLLTLVCNSFGLQRVASIRKQQVHDLIRGARIFVDRDDFVWPSAADPEQMTSYRRNALDYVTINEIHPRELDNFVSDQLRYLNGRLDDEELLHELLRRMGSSRRKLTPTVRRVLAQSVRRVRARNKSNGASPR